MQRVVLAAVAAMTVCFSAGSAQAKDSGSVYGGIVVGNLMGTDRNVETVGSSAFRALGPTIAPSRVKPELDGLSYGVIIGNHYNTNGPLIVGLEIDISGGGDATPGSFSGAPIVVTAPAVSPAPAGLTTSATKEYGLRGSLRGRLGVKVLDGFSVYTTGGLAFAHVETTASVVVNGAPTLAWNGRNTQNLTGWAIGVGAEFEVIDGVIVRGEYIYTDLGDATVTAVGNDAVNAQVTLTGIEYLARTDYRGGEARAGVLLSF
ncbi:outer membrane protein [Aquidulcibacter paucihalophilus]|uniref:outer membrane protein n=1 Tax=Aquidulcibacter paucihalophilus TaxID=1978549 RepID=UPI000A19649F|nr:outer membrane beta-barrel protein [Aquidulcibacter paucihalophilus]